MIKKICTKCKINKVLEEYYKDTRHKDGRASECKSCTIARQKEYQKSDRGKATQAKRNAKYKKTDEGKAVNAKANAKYFKSAKGKAAIARGNHKSRYWKSKTINTLDNKEFDYIIFLQDNKCACCSRTFTDELMPTRDHIYPASKGGDFIKENVQALCVECNSRKKDKYIDYKTDYQKEKIIKFNQ